MVQPWRTSGIVELCEAIRRQKDYSAIPVLCDLLEEANYEDTAQLIKMRSPQDWLTNVTFVARIHSPLTEQAVITIEQMIDRMNARPSWWDDEDERESAEEYPRNEVLTYERVMTLASEISEEGAKHDKDERYWNDNYLVQYGTETWRDNFESETFWKAYALITGDDTVKDEHFFSCNC